MKLLVRSANVRLKMPSAVVVSVVVMSN
jgi:hypothetical protein